MTPASTSLVTSFRFRNKLNHIVRTDPDSPSCVLLLIVSSAPVSARGVYVYAAKLFHALKRVFWSQCWAKRVCSFVRELKFDCGDCGVGVCVCVTVKWKENENWEADKHFPFAFVCVVSLKIKGHGFGSNEFS